MTAEIAILNKEAVALASDSAVTIGQGTKIYNSANKIFTLSKFNPVGIMIFGNATFMGIPWETIIKDFRKKFHDTCFNTLIEYADTFLDFLGSGNCEINLEIQEDYVSQVSFIFFNEIRGRLINEVDQFIKQKNKIEEKQVNKIFKDIIKDYYDKFSKTPRLENLPAKYDEEFKKKFDKKIEEMLKNVFEQLKMNDNEKNNIIKLIVFIFTRQLFPDSTSGMVIAGFGEKDIFPSLVSYNMESSVLGFVKCKKIEYLKADSKGATSIAPYAQSEMVQAFIKGIDPDYRSAIENYLKENLDKFSEMVVDKLEKLKEEQPKEKNRIKKRLKDEIVNEITKNFKNQLDTYSKENHVNSILASVAVLPKDELANMAEAFINLTSFKRRVASDQKETVGGPVDVAVISKGDGFIWIQRKHYFQPELNQHFFRNYFNKRKVEDECHDTKK